MDLSAHIRDIITIAEEMKNNKTADNKALDKVIDRLEDAEMWAKRIWPGRVDGSAHDPLKTEFGEIKTGTVDSTGNRIPNLHPFRREGAE